MPGKGRGRGFFSGGSHWSPMSKRASPALTGNAGGLVSGDGLAGRFSAPPGADCCEERKSDVISPLLLVDRI